MTIPLLFSLISVALVMSVLTAAAIRLVKLIHNSNSGKITMLVAAVLAVCLAIQVLFHYGDDHMRGCLIGMAALFGCFDLFCLAIVLLGKVLDGLVLAR
jgi:hypothetical protein